MLALVPKVNVPPSVRSAPDEELLVKAPKLEAPARTCSSDPLPDGLAPLGEKQPSAAPEASTPDAAWPAEQFAPFAARASAVLAAPPAVADAA